MGVRPMNASTCGSNKSTARWVGGDVPHWCKDSWQTHNSCKQQMFLYQVCSCTVPPHDNNPVALDPRDWVLQHQLDQQHPCR